MKIKSITLLLGSIVVLVSSQNPDQEQINQAMIDSAIQTAKNLIAIFWWRDYQDMYLLGAKCTCQVKYRISAFEFVWDGRFSCERDSYRGNSRGWKSSGGACEHAIIDYFDIGARNKLINQNKLTNMNLDISNQRKRVEHLMPKENLGGGGGSGGVGVIHNQKIL
ncbi:unnamed protein product [Brachionus calyciflorus]|uniref:Uncharacterized protein n=1 Tax=Brachionus calyciflorus TaxID=104777 RepID=A0A814J5V7_9BILA|nr:unnamed protein product [Brachionus calyciflorus]